MTGYFVAYDADGEPTLWRGRPDDHAPYAVAYRSELDRRDPLLWPLLVAILTDEAGTVDRIARALAANIAPNHWAQVDGSMREHYRNQARAVLAELRTGAGA